MLDRSNTLKRFFVFVQIHAKLTGLLTFLLGLCYAYNRFEQININNTALFFIAMAGFELSITGLNNTIDSRKNPGDLPFSRKTAWRILFIFWFISAFSAIWLAARTDAIVFISGVLCFAVGILYSCGPAPISHLPFGELFSGIFEGFFILFLTVYINAPPGSLIGYTWDTATLWISFSVSELAKLALLSAPCVIGIANIMLSNNICDLDQDIKNGRYTLPRYIGNKWSLRLFMAGYYIAFTAMIASVVFKTLPVYSAFSILTLFFIQRNVSAFFKRQDKKTTFFYSVVNLILLVLPLIVSLTIKDIAIAAGYN